MNDPSNYEVTPSYMHKPTEPGTFDNQELSHVSPPDDVDNVDGRINGDPCLPREQEQDHVNVESMLQAKTWKRKAALGMAVGASLLALAFQQSPANEAVRAKIAFDVLKSTENELAVAGAVGAVTMAIEGGTSILIAAGLNQESDLFRKRIKRFRKKELLPEEMSSGEPDQNNKKTASNKLSDVGITLGIGAGLVVVRRHLQEKERTFRKDVVTGLGYAALGSVVSGGIGYLAAGGIEQADKVGLGVPAAYLVEYAANWKFWAAALAGGYAAKWVATKSRQLYRNLTGKERSATDQGNTAA